MSWRLHSLLIVLALAGCGDSTGIPQPDPIPIVSMIRTSRVSVEPSGSVDLVGLPGSVGGAGTVTVTSSTSQTTGPAGSTGTFALTIPSASAGEELAIRYNKSEPASVRVPGIPPPGGPIPPGPIAGVPPVTATTAGKVRVRGQTGQAAGATMLGVNPSLGEVVTAPVAADQTFSFEIAATTGQQLKVYDDDGGPLDGVWVLTVP